MRCRKCVSFGAIFDGQLTPTIARKVCPLDERRAKAQHAKHLPDLGEVPNAAERKRSRWKLVLSTSVMFAAGLLYLSL